jgi:hypothetical protein
MQLIDALMSVGGAATAVGSVLAILLARGTYKFLTKEATIVITQTCDDSYIVRVRVGFGLPRYVSHAFTGATSLWISKAGNFQQLETAEAAGKTALAQRGCPKSKQITTRLRK